MAITINRTTSLDGAILPEYMPGLLYMNENQAHKFVITCTRGGSAVTLTGGITGRFMRADGQTILLSGSISSGKANLTLPQSCYIVPGRFTMAIFNVTGNAVTTIYALTGNVARTQTDTLVDPGNTVPTIDNLLAEIDAMRQATADANAAATKSVRYDTTQSLTDANKSTARGNIDAAGLAQVVRHDASQNLTETQKTTARGNIDAAGLAQVVRNDTMQSLTDAQKVTARSNISAPSVSDLLDEVTAREEKDSEYKSIFDSYNSYLYSYYNQNDFITPAWYQDGAKVFENMSFNKNTTYILTVTCDYNGSNNGYIYLMVGDDVRSSFQLPPGEKHHIVEWTPSANYTYDVVVGWNKTGVAGSLTIFKKPIFKDCIIEENERWEE